VRGLRQYCGRQFFHAPCILRDPSAEFAIRSLDKFMSNITLALVLPSLTRTVPGILGDLRSDHAGEAGAVMIYRGILAGSRDPDVCRFAADHLRTEQAHLEIMDALMSGAAPSLLLPVWRAAGWITGFLPALAGARAVYATIAAVERFVVAHYQDQISKLATDGPAGALRATLEACQSDEAHHRDEAEARRAKRPGLLLRLWTALVGLGSRYAVIAARRV
jgi:ubiquinone biosynthesis monooxygenase Coq7